MRWIWGLTPAAHERRLRFLSAMPFQHRASGSRALSAMVAPDAAIAVRRELLWYLGATDVRPVERRGHFVSAMWSAHVHPAFLPQFDLVGLPLLRAMRGLAGGRAVVVRQAGATFDAGVTHRLVRQCLDVDALVMVELNGDWSTSALHVLGVVRPAFVRIPREYADGASAIPEQARRLALLADCMARSSVPLVVQGPLADDDDRAVRAVGIDLRLRIDSPGGAPPDVPSPSLGTSPRAVVLDFPLRSPGR